MKLKRIWVDDDPEGPIDQWLTYVLLMREAYGPDAIMLLDAGYNNVQVCVEDEV